MKKREIVIKLYSEQKNNPVRISKAAQEVVRRLQMESGASASKIVSEIICQNENYVRFEVV